MKKTVYVLGDLRRSEHMVLHRRRCGWIGQTGDSLMQGHKTKNGVYKKTLKTGPRMASTQMDHLEVSSKDA